MDQNIDEYNAYTQAATQDSTTSTGAQATYNNWV